MGKLSNFLLDVWAFDKEGNKIHPIKGTRGAKAGLFSVNFTNDTNNFKGLSEEQLINAIEVGRFIDRGTIRMLPINYEAGVKRNAFAPSFYKGKQVKAFG